MLNRRQNCSYCFLAIASHTFLSNSSNGTLQINLTEIIKAFRICSDIFYVSDISLLHLSKSFHYRCTHKALGRDRYEQINTFANHSNNTNVKNISFTIKLSNLISPDELNINKLNVFIFVEGNRNNRKEIHVIGYQPTKLANTDLFGGNNDNSSVSGKKYYISKDNLAWRIMVPTDFKWALEYVNIKTVYSLFTDWVTSGGVKNQEWWKTFDSSKVYK